MVIANPIYDVVFKKLMEDERIAKLFIGTLLDETVEEVQVKLQEFTYSERTEGLAVFRLDFIATIKTETGDFKKVLIEIQKSRNPIDLMRFRNYLGEQYKKEDEIITSDSRPKKAFAYRYHLFIRLCIGRNRNGCCKSNPSLYRPVNA